VKDADDEVTSAPVTGHTHSGDPPVSGDGTDRRERRERDRQGRERERGGTRPRGMEALFGGGRQTHDTPTAPPASTSRAAEAVDRGLALFNFQRSGHVVPSRPRALPETTDGPDFEGADVGGRRRSETVTGVMSIGSSASTATATRRPDLTIPPYVPNSTQRSHAPRGHGQPEQSSSTPTSTSRLHRLLPTRNDSGASESSRSGNEDHNMLLG